MKKTLKVLAIVMTLALVMSLAAVSVFAVDYTAIPGTTMSFNKNLVVDSTAQIPNVEFEFSISPGTPVEASSTNMEILAGPTGAVIEKAQFTSGMVTTDGTPDDDTNTSKKFATDVVTVDLTGVTFTKPGVYRYVITETASTLAGVTNDTNATRYLDVFVLYGDHDNDSNTDDQLYVQSYALRNEATNIDLTTGKYATDPDSKSSGYTNELETYDIEFAKTISGNQADKNKKFTFTLEITGANPGKYAIAVVGTNVITDGSGVTDGMITVAADGTYTGTFALTDGESVKVLELPKGSTYTVTEAPEDYTSTAGTAANFTDATTGSITKNISTGYNNDRSGITPTGVIITVAPFAIGILVFGAVMLYMISRRRRLAY